MKIKTSELTGAALDWAAAKCEGLEMEGHYGPFEGGWNLRDYPYSTDWAQGGPIIEREGIWLRGPNNATKPDGTIVLHIDYWYAHNEHKNVQNGPTPLIAAMRCFISSRLGDEVEVPEELTC